MVGDRRLFHLRYDSPISHPDNLMNIHLALTPIISLIAGILVLVMPKMLSYIVGLYLIVIGLIGIFGTGALHMH